MNISVAPLPESAALRIIASAEALELVAGLHATFEPRRRELLERRHERFDAKLALLEETREVRVADWLVCPAHRELEDRRVEITGPPSRKMVINALNSGASGFMADFEDATSPTWENLLDGQLNLHDVVRRTISYESSDGRRYGLAKSVATLLLRPRGWHLEERHLTVEGDAVAGAFVDFGFFMSHCARELVAQGSGPFFYLPKLESHLEARLWADVFAWTERELRLAPGTTRCTVLIETLPAAFEMDEILFELRAHSCALNAGRWDYIFSTIKRFRDDPGMVLPDRRDVTMTVPFMRAYTKLLVATCHRRGAHAMGGMAAMIPNRRDLAANAAAIAMVRADKAREVSDGFDGTWVAHPDLVSVAMAEFDAVLEGRPNQVHRQQTDVRVTADELLTIAKTPGKITERGVRDNIGVAFRYVSFWLTGRGAAAINGLMEDAATAEICRAQLWQWIRRGARMEDGTPVTHELVQALLEDETRRIRSEVGEETWSYGRPDDTRAVFEQLVFAPDFPEFLTLVAQPFLAGCPDIRADTAEQHA